MATPITKKPEEIEGRIMQLLARFPLTEASVKQLLFSVPDQDVMQALDRLVKCKRATFGEGVYRYNFGYKPTYTVEDIERHVSELMKTAFGGEITPASTGRAEIERAIEVTLGERRFDILITDRTDYSQAADEGPQDQ